MLKSILSKALKQWITQWVTTFCLADFISEDLFVIRVMNHGRGIKILPNKGSNYYGHSYY